VALAPPLPGKRGDTSVSGWQVTRNAAMITAQSSADGRVSALGVRLLAGLIHGFQVL
jgi:hypothetical protein